MPHLCYVCHKPIKVRFHDFLPKNGFWSQFVTLFLLQSNPNGPALCPYSLNDQLAYLKNGHVLKKCPGNGNNITDYTIVHLTLAFWGILGYFPAPPLPEEPLSGPFLIPIAT